MEQYSIEIGAVTDKGNVKPSNQDNILVQIGEYKGGEFGLFVVCDGLGGLAFGEVASVIAVKKFKKWWEEQIKEFIKNTDDEKIMVSLKKAVYESNIEIIDYSNKIAQRVGTTISAILVMKNKYYIVHVGDTRIYKITNKIEQLTEDHSYVAMQVRAGKMTAKEAKESKSKNLLMQCIGVKESIEIYERVGILKGGETFLISSDGFYNKLYEWEILEKIKKSTFNHEQSLQDVANILVEEVKNRKERDNISVILVSLEKKEEEKLESKSLFKRLFK